MAKAEPELKPCPFCGSSAQLSEHEYGQWRAVYCLSCPGAVIDYYKTTEENIAAWNRRDG